MNRVGLVFFLPGLQWIGVLLALFASSAKLRSASSVTLEWDPSFDPNVAGYIVYYGAVGGRLINQVGVGNEASATITNLFEGTTNFFNVVAYNVQGIASPPSDTLLLTVPGVYLPPTISDLPDRVIAADTASGPIFFRISDAQFPSSQVDCWATSSNPDLVPAANILGGSGSDRILQLNRTLGVYGSAAITVTADDGIATTSRTFLLTVSPVLVSVPLPFPREAESGTLLSPMTVLADPTASAGHFIASPGPSSGTASFTVDVPFSSSWVVWCRVMRPPAAAGSFVVSADSGRRDVFDVDVGNATNDWQWLVLSARGGLFLPPPAGADPINPRVFPFTAGRHTLTFQGRDPGTALDQILISNDPTFVPAAVPSTLLLDGPPDQRIDELTTLSVTNTAAASSPSVNRLTFSLAPGLPSGLTIDPTTGVLTWTPTEAQGPSTNLVTVLVSDDGSPPMSATRSFRVVVNEVNSAPLLTVPADLTVDELTRLVLPSFVSDPDIPENAMTFSLLSAPVGMLIDQKDGTIEWTPAEDQGPSTNLVTVRVTDSGSPPLSDVRSFSIVVNDVNSAPVLTVPLNRSIHGLATLVVTNMAVATEVPTNTLTFSLLAAPAGVTLEPATGVLTWTPGQNASGGL